MYYDFFAPMPTFSIQREVLEHTVHVSLFNLNNQKPRSCQKEYENPLAAVVAQTNIKDPIFVFVGGAQHFD